MFLHLLEFIYNARFGFGADENAWQQHAFAFGLSSLRTNGSCTAQKALQHELGGYAKQIVGGPKQIIDYIGRYSPKFAISNHRSKKGDDRKVSFAYKNYAAGGVSKIITLETSKFLPRFCMYILLKSRNRKRNKLYEFEITFYCVNLRISTALSNCFDYLEIKRVIRDCQNVL